MVGKQNNKIVGLAILILICWIGYSPPTCRATVVWSDDFDDGNYDGWTVCNNTELYDGQYGFSGSNWSAANGYLQLDHEELGIITHPSEEAYGTWSFDLCANESNIGTMIDVGIISTDHFHTAMTENDWISPERTVIWIRFEVFAEEDMWTLNKRYDADHTVIDYGTFDHDVEWQHIEVTRNTTGWFSVYHNHSPDPFLEGLDTDITTSVLFSLWFEDRVMIDNIVVDNELHTTTPPPPIDLVPIAAVASAVVIIAVLVVILKRR